MPSAARHTSMSRRLLSIASSAVSKQVHTASRVQVRSMSVTVNIMVPTEGLHLVYMAMEDTNLKTVADENPELKSYLECACNGNAMCSTCHVYVDPQWMDRLVPPAEDELDILDLVANFKETSRLGCQISLTNELDGITVTVPDEVNNLM